MDVHFRQFLEEKFQNLVQSIADEHESVIDGTRRQSVPSSKSSLQDDIPPWHLHSLPAWKKKKQQKQAPRIRFDMGERDSVPISPSCAAATSQQQTTEVVPLAPATPAPSLMESATESAEVITLPEPPSIFRAERSSLLGPRQFLSVDEPEDELEGRPGLRGSLDSKGTRLRASLDSSTSFSSRSPLGPGGGVHRRCLSVKSADVIRHRSIASSSSAVGRSISRRMYNRGTTEGDLMKFEVLDFWQKYRSDRNYTIRRRKTPPLMGSSAVVVLDDEPDELETEARTTLPNHWSHWIYLHPSSRKRFVWDVTSLGLLVSDIIMIPLLFFSPPQTTFWQVMSWIACIFWTVDIVVSFLTGFSDLQGVIEMRPIFIARRYVRSWLALDLFMVIGNWLDVIVDTHYNFDGGHRAFRFLRVLRLVRMIKASEISSFVVENIRDEQVMAAAGIIKILILILITAHIISCTWYGLSQSGLAKARNWVWLNSMQDDRMFKKYLWSFHWSLSQFTGPDTEIKPENLYERLFAVCVLLFAYVCSAVFISSITTSMTRLELAHETQQVPFVMLRRYLSLNRISGKLSSRVQRNAFYVLRERTLKVPEQDVELLQLVSEPLRVELHYEIFSPALKHHPLLRKYDEISPLAFRKLCHTAVQVKMFSKHDVVFSDEETPTAPCIFFLTHGAMQYISGEGQKQTIMPVTWICEACLWTEWTFLGTLRAVSDSRLLAIDSYAFHVTTDQFRSRDFKPEEYAKKFVDRLNCLLNDGKTSTYGHGEVSDLLADVLDWDELLGAAFPKDEEIKLRLTTRAVSQFERSQSLNSESGNPFRDAPSTKPTVGDDFDTTKKEEAASTESTSANPPISLVPSVSPCVVHEF